MIKFETNEIGKPIIIVKETNDRYVVNNVLSASIMLNRLIHIKTNIISNEGCFINTVSLGYSKNYLGYIHVSKTSLKEIIVSIFKKSIITDIPNISEEINLSVNEIDGWINTLKFYIKREREKEIYVYE